MSDFEFENKNAFFVVAREKKTGKLLLRLEDYFLTRAEAETYCGEVKMDDYEDEFDFEVLEVVKYE